MFILLSLFITLL